MVASGGVEKCIESATFGSDSETDRRGAAIRVGEPRNVAAGDGQPVRAGDALRRGPPLRPPPRRRLRRGRRLPLRVHLASVWLEHFFSPSDFGKQRSIKLSAL